MKVESNMSPCFEGYKWVGDSRKVRKEPSRSIFKADCKCMGTDWVVDFEEEIEMK